MLAGDDQPRFGQQEVDVGDAPVQRVLDRDHRAIGAALLHGFDCVFERETGQRQRIGEGLFDGDLRIGARRTLKRNRTPGRCGGGRSHRGDDRERGGGIVLHARRALAALCTAASALADARGRL